MATTVKFNEKGAIEAISISLCHALETGGVLLQRELKRTLKRHNSGTPANPGKPSSVGQPPGLLSGNLRRSVQVDLSECKTKHIVRVGTNLKYGRLHEFGGTFSRREILPKKGKALRFKVDGKVVFVKRIKAGTVNVPSRPWMRPTAIKKKRDIRDAILVAFRKKFIQEARRRLK